MTGQGVSELTQTGSGNGQFGLPDQIPGTINGDNDHGKQCQQDQAVKLERFRHFKNIPGEIHRKVKQHSRQRTATGVVADPGKEE